MRKRVPIIIGIIFLLIIGYVVITISRYMAATKKDERQYYSEAAGIPSYAEYIEDHNFSDFRGSSHVFLQTRKFKSSGEMCNNLPAGFSEAINAALSSGVSENAVDLKNKPVRLYEISPRRMPLTNNGSKNKLECHYCVFEYPDGNYRFALISEIAFTR